MLVIEIFLSNIYLVVFVVLFAKIIIYSNWVRDIHIVKSYIYTNNRFISSK